MLRLPILLAAAALSAAAADLPPPADRPVDFVKDIQPLFQQACLKCHGPEKQKSAYRLDVKALALTGGDSHAPNILPGNSAQSPLIHFVAGLDPDATMPPKDPPLSPAQIGLLRRWIDDGAAWPDSASAALADKTDWWSLKPLLKPPVPTSPSANAQALDAFIQAKLQAHGLSPSPEADPRTLCRRLYFDLTGLPPSPEEVAAFVQACALEKNPADAYRQLVDQLLASPRYGERWARHWLDVVHFGETHGYDKDQPRPHAWPYRDYVIRAFNEDRPYARFVQEQLAGDVLFPGSKDGLTALGFIAAGPWDFIGHAEVGEEKIDGQIARHLDRDDMSANAINTFCSMTVHCAQCHDHKFDPITAEDYYSLQSVFAALDRTDRPYDDDPQVATQRAALQSQRSPLALQRKTLQDRAQKQAGDSLAALDRQIAALQNPRPTSTQGWHSNIEPKPDAPKWVQIDLGAPATLSQVVLHPCHDDYNQIGNGFGFPPRFKIEASDDPTFQQNVTPIADHTAQDHPNPGIQALAFPTSTTARYLRVTATALASRKDGFFFSLAELDALDPAGKNLAAAAPVSSLDSIEAPGAWSRTYLTDQSYPGASPSPPAATAAAIAKLSQAKHLIFEAVLGETEAATWDAASRALADLDRALQALPPPQLVYAGGVHTGSGAFVGTGAKGGQPRPITVLSRGDVRKPGRPASPGAISGITALPARFNLPPDAPEGARRAALAHWITDPQHPLTWRSIVNRVWHYHFGRGLVNTPNDFGHMGDLPSHPELLDWLAATFRDDLGGSLKQLHRLILTSATYRQQSGTLNDPAEQFDSNNTLLWRQNRRKLEAEALRDSVLAVAGKLDLTPGGPSFQDFVITHPEHSPHYEYPLADPENPALYRRSVYRFLVRSQQQPWMAALDCADPSMLVDKRNQTISPLQALAQLNNPLMIAMAQHFAARLAAADPSPAAQITTAFHLALQRDPTPPELASLVEHASKFGLPNACRLIVNLNEFTFID